MNILEQIIGWFRAEPSGVELQIATSAYELVSTSAAISLTVLPSPAAAMHDERGYAGIRAQASRQDELQRRVCDVANGKGGDFTKAEYDDLHMIGLEVTFRDNVRTGRVESFISNVQEPDDANSDRL